MVIVAATALGWGLRVLDVIDIVDSITSGDETAARTDPASGSASSGTPLAPTTPTTVAMLPGTESLTWPDGVPGDAIHPCPSWDTVNELTGRNESMNVDVERRLLVNGVPLVGTACNYGEAVSVGELPPGTDAVTPLSTSQGEAQVGGHEAGDRAVRLAEPDGAVRVVFEVAGRQRWVRVEPADVGVLEPLIQVMTTQGL